MTVSDYATNHHGEPRRSVCVATDFGEVFLLPLVDGRLEVVCKGHLLGFVQKAEDRWNVCDTDFVHRTRRGATCEVARRWAAAHGGRLPQYVSGTAHAYGH